MTEVGMHEAKTKLSQLVARAEAGEDIVITRRGEPAVRLVPAGPRRTLADLHGDLAGEVWVAEDFDDLPDDMAEALGLRG